jgi:DegV family protein with EDD domain
MEKIKIVTDTDSGLTNETCEENNIYLFRKPLICGVTEIIDTVTLTYEEFLNELKSGKLYHTSQMPTEIIFDVFTEILKEYDKIIYIPISSKMSTAWENGVKVCSRFGDRVKCIDVLGVAQMEGYEVLIAAELLKKGYPFEKICEILESRAGNQFAYVIPESIKWLKLGGRITPGAAAMAGLLHVLPILQVREGAVEKFDTARSLKQCYIKSIQALINRGVTPATHDLMILHSSLPEAAEEVINIAKTYPQLQGFEFIKGTIPGIVLCHTGPGTIAICAVKKFIF